MGKGPWRRIAHVRVRSTEPRVVHHVIRCVIGVRAAPRGIGRVRGSGQPVQPVIGIGPRAGGVGINDGGRRNLAVNLAGVGGREERKLRPEGRLDPREPAAMGIVGVGRRREIAAIHRCDLPPGIVLHVEDVILRLRDRHRRGVGDGFEPPREIIAIDPRCRTIGQQLLLQGPVGIIDIAGDAVTAVDGLDRIALQTPRDVVVIEPLG